MLNNRSLLLLITILVIGNSQLQKLEAFFKSCLPQLKQWMGIEASEFQALSLTCHFKESANQMLEFYSKLAEHSTVFKKSHVDLIAKEIKNNNKLRECLKCIIDARSTTNQFFSAKKKYKEFAKFASHVSQKKAEWLIVGQGHFQEKGRKMGVFLRSFFEYYYLQVQHPSETLSTTLLRALTLKTDIFAHEDIIRCVSLETSGQITTSLQSLQISNIFIKIPEVFDALKYIKFRSECQQGRYLKMMQDIHDKLKGIDMFKVMYNDYKPYVKIAAEKFGNFQIKMLAQEFAKIIKNPSHFQGLTGPADVEL